MARDIEVGLDYFPFDVNFFQDRKVRKLQKMCDEFAPIVFVALLCAIAKEGYYIKWDDDFCFDFADSIHIDEKYVKKVLNTCFEVGLISKDMLDENGILTSHGIQKQYQKICIQSKRKSRVTQYSLLNISEGIDLNTERMQQSKVKESKVNYFVNNASLGSEETEKEKIIYFFTFERNWVAPSNEYDRLIAYNKGIRSWSKLSAQKRSDYIARWEPEDGKTRFSKEFLGIWKDIFDTILADAPEDIRAAALSDGFHTKKNGMLTFCCKQELADYLEQNIAPLKKILMPFIQSIHCKGLAYLDENEKPYPIKK